MTTGVSKYLMRHYWDLREDFGATVDPQPSINLLFYAGQILWNQLQKHCIHNKFTSSSLACCCITRNRESEPNRHDRCANILKHTHTHTTKCDLQVWSSAMQWLVLLVWRQTALIRLFPCSYRVHIILCFSYMSRTTRVIPTDAANQWSKLISTKHKWVRCLTRLLSWRTVGSFYTGK